MCGAQERQNSPCSVPGPLKAQVYSIPQDVNPASDGEASGDPPPNSPMVAAPGKMVHALTMLTQEGTSVLGP